MLQRYNQFVNEEQVKKYNLEEFIDANKKSDPPKAFFVYESNKPVLNETRLLSDYSTYDKDIFVPFVESEELSYGGKIYFETKFDFTNYSKVSDDKGKKFNVTMDKYIMSLTNPVYYKGKRVLSVDFYYDLDEKKEEILLNKLRKMVDLFIELDMEKEGRSSDFYLIKHNKNSSDIKLVYKPFNKFIK